MASGFDFFISPNILGTFFESAPDIVMGRVPENPTRPEGFLLARTRPEPEKVQTRPENPKKPEFLEK